MCPCLPPGTDKPFAANSDSKAADEPGFIGGSAMGAGGSADLGDQLLHDVPHVGGHLGVLARMLAVE
jgi:hypothetical protein